jgi:pimeloyl-ACP methyl ester carboxylesterase
VVESGPKGGQPVVLIHGLSTPSQVWGPLSQRLNAAGYRTLAFDLYGRGLSGRPERPHEPRLYMRQVTDVLDEAKIGGPVPLVGFSMGAVIATELASAHPERVSGIALLAPAGLAQGPTGFAALCARLPVIGDALWSIRAGEELRASARAEAKDPRCEIDDLTKIMWRETNRRGTLPALLSSIRRTLSTKQDSIHRALGHAGLPVLAIWGVDDEIVPITSMGRLGNANPEAENHALPGARHGLPYMHAEAVCGYLTDWLGRLSAPSAQSA